MSVTVQSHVAQHHDGAQQQGGGVGQIFACNIRGGSVYLSQQSERALKCMCNVESTTIMLFDYIAMPLLRLCNKIKCIRIQI